MTTRKVSVRAPRGRGRPLTLTSAVQRRICSAIEAGNFVESAAQLAGVGRSTLYRWLSLADSDDKQYRDFRDALLTARAKAEARAVAVIVKSGRRSWQSAAWFLERSFPDRWKRREHHEDLPAQSDLGSFGQPTVGDRLDAAMQRSPGEIPRVLAALNVLREVTESE